MTRRLPLLIFATALLSLCGCGEKFVPVTGSVTIDGKAVAGASVTFLSDDGKHTSGGTTDESGNFTLASGADPGVRPGNYKVTVTKYPKVEGSAPTGDPAADKNYINQMKKEMAASKTGGPMIPNPKTGGMPQPGPPGGMTAGGAKSELPAVYASIETTPLTVKVPPDGPVKLELKSK